MLPMIKVSICIATLNRRNFIGETLTAILDQLPRNWEIIIVDGASTDGTKDVVEELFQGRSNCHYFRLQEKGGVDQDYSVAVEKACGEFCWLMTDDDVVTTGAIKKVLSKLGDDLDLLLVNSTVLNAELSEVLIERRLQISDDRRFEPGSISELMAVAGDLLSFIGTVVIRTSVWKARTQSPYFGTEFVHVGVIFQKPLERAAIAIAEPLIRIRYGNAQWTPRTFQIWMFKWPQLIWSFPDVSESAKRAVVLEKPYKHFSQLLGMKVSGSFGLRQYRDHLCREQMSFMHWFPIWLLAVFPGAIFNPMLRVVAAIRKWPPMTRFELAASPDNFLRPRHRRRK